MSHSPQHRLQKGLPWRSQFPKIQFQQAPSRGAQRPTKIARKIRGLISDLTQELAQAPIRGAQRPTKITRTIRGLISDLTQKLAQEPTPKGYQMSH